MLDIKTAFLNAPLHVQDGKSKQKKVVLMRPPAVLVRLRLCKSAPVANPCVSGLVVGLLLQFCALAGRRPETLLLLAAQARPADLCTKAACSNHCAAGFLGAPALAC